MRPDHKGRWCPSSEDPPAGRPVVPRGLGALTSCLAALEVALTPLLLRTGCPRPSPFDNLSQGRVREGHTWWESVRGQSMGPLGSTQLARYQTPHFTCPPTPRNKHPQRASILLSTNYL